MALTKLPKNAFGTGSVDDTKIEDGTIQNQEISGTLPETKLATGTIENAKLSNSSITINGTSISLGGSSSVGVDVNWQSVITADGSTTTTSVAGNGYFIDTTSATHTINLPASASLGDQIAIKDYAGTFASNNLTIGRNGHNIQGVANDSLISTNRASLLLVYVDSTKGWIYAEESNVADLQVNSFIEATGGTVSTSGDYKIHTFTGDGCFVVSTIGAGPTGGPANVDYLVVAGGGSGGGGNGYYGGGGGAGGYRTTFPSPGCNAGAFPISVTTYPITVGAGGADVSSGFNGPGNPGSNSVFSTITSSGGGAGSFGAGAPGGSGGGATSGSTLGGTGNTPPVSPPQGNPGGNAESGNQNCNAGGGGGGAAAAGTNVVRCGGPGTGGISTAGPGGAGSPNAITGSSTTYAGGGGGGVTLYPPGPGGNSNLHVKGTGGAGGGGDGGDFGPAGGSPATAGSANTGGGGGGSSQNPDVGRAGGKGIVIIRYKYQ